jgi:UDP:flavonoid glycosyltransferase YjiC (YdhE family)
MRVLVSIRPYFGHLHPSVPLASELVRRGHQVTFATAASFCPIVTAAGFECAAAGLHPSDPLPPEHEGKPYARDYGVYPVTVKCEDILKLAAAAPPDMIVRDPTDVGAVVAAEVLGVPCVTLGFSEFIPPPSWDVLLGSGLDTVRSAWRLGGDPRWERMHPAGYFNLVPGIFRESSWDIPGERPLRPVCKQALETVPAAEWLDQLPARPTVHLTLGTAYNFHVGLLTSLIQWLSRLPISLICTAGADADLPALRSAVAGDGTYLTDYLPLEAILPRCDAVVTAGGFNTVMGALQFGLPLIVVPLGADQPRNAGRVAALGAGLRIAADAVDQDTVASALRAVLVEPSYRVNAARIQERIERMPGPAEAALYLETIDERR